MDLTLKNARLAAAPEEVIDIGVEGGRIAALRPGLPQGGRTHDLGGRIVLPGFCESHIHLDKSCILERCTLRGGLPEAIGEVAGLKADFTAEDVAARAGRTLRKCVLNGTTRMRTHVEVDPTVGTRGGKRMGSTSVAASSVMTSPNGSSAPLYFSAISSRWRSCSAAG